MQRKLNLKREILRKIIHSSGLSFYFFKNWLPLSNPLFWLFILFFINFVEILRSLQILSFLNKLFRSALREKELENFSGAFYYFWGIGLVFLFFPLKASFLSLWVLCVADGIAGLFGRSWLHSFSFFLISLLIATFFTGSLNTLLLLKVALWTIIERKLPPDDNLTVPLAVAFTCIIQFRNLK